MLSILKVAIRLLLLQGLKKAPVKDADSWPRLLPLRRESVPVLHDGKVVSHRTSYSGAISFGSPAQDFRVLFDTGSGHLVIPSSTCKSETCLAHHQYNMSNSVTAKAINTDGSWCSESDLCDEV